MSWYTQQASDLFKSQNKEYLHGRAGDGSVHNELKVFMANLIASNIANGSSIKLEAICITTHLPSDSIYYIVVLKVPRVVH